MSQTKTFEPGQRVHSKKRPTHIGSEFASINGTVVGRSALNDGWIVIRTDDDQLLQFHRDDLVSGEVFGKGSTPGVRSKRLQLTPRQLALLIDTLTSTSTECEERSREMEDPQRERDECELSESLLALRADIESQVKD